MKPRKRCRPTLAALLGIAVALSTSLPAYAQSADGGFRMAVAAGPTLNDLETGGVDWMFVGGVELRPDGGPLVLTADVRYLSYTLAEREQLIMPEVGLQLQTAFGPMHPFIGLGGGLQYAVRPGDNGQSLSAHLATGLRIRLTRSLDLRLEARGRSLDPFIDFTGGFAIAL